MAVYFVKGATGETIGPVSYDQLARGAATGKVPRGTSVRREDSTVWQPVEVILGLDTAPPRAAARAPSPQPVVSREQASSTDGHGTERGYNDLKSAAESLKTQAAVAKFLGFALVVGSVLGGMSVGAPFGYALVLVGVMAWAALHVAGVFIGATGDAMAALREIALNTRRR